MRKVLRTFHAFTVVALAACASSATPDPAAPTPGGGPAAASGGEVAMAEPAEAPTSSTATTLGGSFSEAQADRGRDTFRATCTECHYSSEFSDAQFKFKWSRRSAGNLYQLIQTSMPETVPGSLTDDETVDLVSYILRMNGFEPGAEELAPDRTLLDAISLASIRSR